MKKTIIYICGKIDGTLSLEVVDATLVTEFKGLYECSSIVEKYIDGKYYYTKRIVDIFSKDDVIRRIFLAPICF